MKPHILFIHGAGRGAYEEDAFLAQSLQEALGGDYVIRYPKMVNEDSPECAEWESQIKSELASLHGEVVLVGHSFGASVLLKYVMHHKDEISLTGLFLIAAPFWGADDFWQWKDGELPQDADARLSETPIFFYHGRNDEIVPFAHLERFAAKLPGAKIRESERQGHQLENDLTEVAADIGSVCEGKKSGVKDQRASFTAHRNLRSLLPIAFSIYIFSSTIQLA